jgi:ketosteroid isomerase-like protein
MFPACDEYSFRSRLLLVNGKRRRLAVSTAVLACALTAAGLVPAAGVGRSASAHAQTAPVPTPTLTPDQTRHVQAVLAFYAAYNRRDVGGLLSLLAPGFRYADCNFSTHRNVLIEAAQPLQRWLRARFREHDRFQIVGDFRANPGPGTAGVGGDVIRHSHSLDPLVAQGLIPSDNNGLGKFVVNASDKIELAGIAGTPFCLAGTRPNGSKPKQERALANAFLRAYNRHDVTGVLGTLAPDVSYSDCAPVADTAKTQDLSGRAAVAVWLRGRFAAGDRIDHARILVDSYLSEPPYSSLTIVIRGVRPPAAGDGSTRPIEIVITPSFGLRQIRTWEIMRGCSPPSS